MLRIYLTDAPTITLVRRALGVITAGLFGHRAEKRECSPEFFAVVVEQFFEKPAQLARQHAELYAELARFFRFDPAARLEQVGPITTR